MKVLCADDSQIMRRIIRETVETLGFEFIEAADGQEAIDTIIKLNGMIDVLLLDWNMPEPNGYQVLEWVKRNPAYRQIPVMMVTTESERTNITKAIKAGAKHYLTKPFASEDLAARILECLGMA